MWLRNLIFIIFFTAGLACNLFAQSSSPTLSIIAGWSKGEKHDYRVTKTKQQWKGEALTKIDTVQYVGKFEVLDSNSTSYKISWTFSNDLTNIYNLPDSLLEKFAKYQITKVIYTTSKKGVFTGIQNWKEIGQLMKDLFTDLGAYSDLRYKLNHVELKKAMDSYNTVYGSKEGIEQLVFKELQFLHFPYGVKFSTKDTLTYSQALPNMFGGDPIKGDVKIFFKNIDYKKSICILNQQMQLNPDDTKQIMKQVFTNMSMNDADMQEALKTARFEMSDHNTFEFHFSPGQPVKIETLRETIMDMNNGKSKWVDRISIELIK